MKFITSCCGKPSDECAGCPGMTTLIRKDEKMDLGEKIGIDWEKVDFTKSQFEKGVKAETKEHHDDPETKVISNEEEAAKIAWAHLKEDPKYYDKLEKMEESKHPIFKKIEENTVTKEDFNSLISESMPESARDKVRRRTLDKNNRNTLDNDGHQIGEPDLANRVQPKREKSSRTQMTGRGKAAHRASTRAQRRKSKVSEDYEGLEDESTESGNILSRKLKEYAGRTVLYIYCNNETDLFVVFPEGIEKLSSNPIFELHSKDYASIGPAEQLAEEFDDYGGFLPSFIIL